MRPPGPLAPGMALPLAMLAAACTAGLPPGPNRPAAGEAAAGVGPVLPGFATAGQRDHGAREQRFRKAVSAAGLRDTLTDLASRQRPASTEAGRAAAAALLARWEAMGLDAGLWEFRARIPNLAAARVVLLVPEQAPLEITPREDPLPGIWPAAAGPVPPPFVAWSEEADLEAEVVYAFHGRPEDYDLLAAHDISLQDRIVLLRAADIIAAQPALARAAEQGAAAVLLAPEVPAADETGALPYPRGPAPAADAVRRDVLLPPRRPGPAGRLPVHPLGEREAALILAALGGAAAPADWPGAGGTADWPGAGGTADWPGAGGTAAHLGPGPARVALELGFDTSQRQAVNVLARLIGADWPDQFVILGAARDAWALDAAENGSSVAALTEVARGLARLQATGWRPRRTILLAAWDASIPGGLGAAAWLGEGPLALAGKTVAYLDAGQGLAGPRTVLAATSDLRHTLEMLDGGAPARDFGRTPPDVHRFLAQGVPAVEIARPGGAGPAAGTAHDTLHRLEQFVDPELSGPVEGARLWGTLALRLADALLPPLNHAATAQEALAAVGPTLEEAYRTFADNPPRLTNVRLALLRLRRAAEAWNEASLAALSHVRTRGDAGSLARWGAAGAASLSVRGLLTGEPLPVFDGCTNLLFCPDPAGGPAIPLPGLRAALSAADRSSFVTQTLTLITAVQAATLRLEEAMRILQQKDQQP